MDRETEHACLEALVAGRDEWPQFWRLFGKMILWELHKLGISAPEERQDLCQDLLAKLLAGDCGILRGYLAGPRTDSIAAYLRVITRHIGISRLRRPWRFKEIPLLEVDAADPGSGSADWAADPARRYEREQMLHVLLLQATGGDAGSTGYRIMHLRFARQVSVNLIAAQLKLSPNAVAQRIRYYLSRLRKEFGIALREHGDG